MTNLTARDLLRRAPIFCELSESDIDKLATATTDQALPAGHVLYHQGDKGEGFYLLISGQVRIAKRLDTGTDVELRVVVADEFFGEMSLIDGVGLPGTATVIEDARLLIIHRTDDPDFYIYFLMRSKVLLRGLLRLLTRDVRSSNEHRFGLVQQEEKIRAESELERLRSLSQMVAGVAHEINTPLGIIANATTLVTEMLRGNAISTIAHDDEGRETLQDVADACRLIEKNVAVAARLVTSFKSLSVRQISEARERVDILKVLEETVDLYRFKARSSHLSFHIDCNLQPSQRFWDGFPGYLSQIVLNFVTNIDRYAYPDGTGGKVELTLRLRDDAQRGKTFELAVRDYGKGIPQENIGQVFDPFFTTGRDKDGTGLGLAIVYNLTTTGLRGSVTVQSKLGQGTTFTVSFPQIIPEGAKS